MNIVVYNEAKQLIDNLGIDVIKSVTGVFSVAELKQMVGTMYYERLILDVTSIKDYKSSMVMQNLANNFDMNKVILILENNEAGVNPQFISGIISLGIYNFTRNKEGVHYFLKTTNTYRDVAHLHQTDKIASAPIEPTKVQVKQKIVGFYNVTEHAGASTLIYMLMKNINHLEKVVALEVDKYDFKYFRNPNMIATKKEELESTITSKYPDYPIILIDLNDYEDCSICSDIIYLIEPTVIKMNKLTAKNRDFMTSLKFKKVVLNMSNISNEAIADFEHETGLTLLANVKSVNDRDEHHPDVAILAEKLGLVTGGVETKKGVFHL